MTEGNGEVGELPTGWLLTKLGQVCEVVRGGSPRPMGDPKYFSGNIPFIKIADITKIKEKTIFDAETKVNEKGSKKSRLLPKGSLILSNSGTVCVPKFLGTEACIHDGFVSFLGLPKEISKEFLFYYFQYLRPYVVQKHKQGITQVNLNIEIVSDFDLKLPPTNEQNRIIEKIEELFSDLDQGIESLKTAQKQLKVYRQAVLKWAFEGKLTEEWRKQHSSTLKTGEALLAQIKAERENRYQQQLAEWETAVKEWEAIGKVGKKPPKPQKLKELKPLTEIELVELPEIPSGWCWIKLNEIAEKITDGEHATPKRTQEGYYLLSARNVQNGFLSLEDVDYIPEYEYLRIIQRCHPEEGDILISCSGSIGRVCRVPKNLQFTMVRSVALVKIRSKPELSKYLEYQLQAPFLQKIINSKKKATAQANLFIGPISELPIALSALEEQEQIVEEIESRLSICDQLEATIIKNLQKAEVLRQSILKQAFEGKLVPQDPNDEPAEKLLERIKAERQVDGNTGKKSKPSHQQLILQDL